MELAKLAEHLEAPQMMEWINSKPGADTKIVFWSLTCSPCLEKLTTLDPTSSQEVIVPVNVDPYSDKEQSAETLKKLAPKFSFYHDKERFMMDTFKVDYLPTYVLIDSKGFIKDILSGPSIQ